MQGLYTIMTIFLGGWGGAVHLMHRYMKLHILVKNFEMCCILCCVIRFLFFFHILFLVLVIALILRLFHSNTGLSLERLVFPHTSHCNITVQTFTDTFKHVFNIHVLLLYTQYINCVKV